MLKFLGKHQSIYEIIVSTVCTRGGQLTHSEDSGMLLCVLIMLAASKQTANDMRYLSFCFELNTESIFANKFSLQVRAEKDRAYFWRSVPQAKECTVSMDPIPPDSVKDILVENVLYTSSSKRLLFDLSWTPPVPYGQLKDYDLIILDNDDRDRLLFGANIDNLEPYHRQTLTVNKMFIV